MAPNFAPSKPCAELELQRLNQLCLPPWDKRIKSRTLRPERPEYAMYTGTPPNERWARVLKYIYENIAKDGIWFRDNLLQKVLGFHGRMHGGGMQALAAILYQKEAAFGSEKKERSSEAAPSFKSLENQKFLSLYLMRHQARDTRSCIKPLLQRMVFVDYGLGDYTVRFSEPGSSKAALLQKWNSFEQLLLDLMEIPRRFTDFPNNPPCFNDLGNVMWALDLDDVDYSDIIAMIYYYCTHRRQPALAEHDQSLTGYTGVMQELISEVPYKGVERLVRKLSVDVNELIPKLFKDPGIRARLIANAKSIAEEHGITLHAPEVRGLGKPLFETLYSYGFSTRATECLSKHERTMASCRYVFNPSQNTPKLAMVEQLSFLEPGTKCEKPEELLIDFSDEST
ncbi:hypothetical protein G7046_g1404 [Stylonectria norvegica]|nr:hypothetical protein G7046_g1404 [Stylonectria norvegica]